MDNLQLLLLRRQNNLSQEQVARFLGVSRSTYIHYERGTRKISVDAMEKLLKLYGKNICLGDSNETNEIDDANYQDSACDNKYLSQLSKSERDIVVKLRMLKKDQLKKVDDFIEDFLNEE